LIRIISAGRKLHAGSAKQNGTEWQQDMALTLTFLGGAGTVTGSKYLLQDGKTRILVDCGLFQGFKALRLRNWAPLQIPPGEISAVILTHAHLDHSGYLPLLVRNGFRGPILSTAATRDLCEILLPDSGRLQEQDADFANRHHFSKHHPALPLYTEQDSIRALKHFKTAEFGKPFAVAENVQARFFPAGHILGAASLVLAWAGKTIVFSGDIGRYGDPLMVDPQTPPVADYLLIESTYGNRNHEQGDVEDALETIIGETIHRGGTVIVPAFAVGRTQTLIFHIARLKEKGRLPKLMPVYLDSPMAIDATELFKRHAREQRLGPGALSLLDRDIRYVRQSAESKALTANPMPKVIISASGMATGGRVLHHLKHYATDRRNTILFTGFQAGGTRGAAMVAGADSIKIHGAYMPVRAEVHNLSMLSAHADRSELLRWTSRLSRPPKTAFIVHGEPDGADALRHALEEQRQWQCVVPQHGETVTLP
jgi:metallo-beta-lactamase family protein